MSEKNIRRWGETITPRDTSAPWVMGPGGSFDMLEVQPIPDEMLAELTQAFAYSGTPWNCRSLPLSPSDREYMYLLYYSMQGLIARMRAAEKELSAAQSDRLTLAMRLYGESDDSFAPETFEVMKRMRPIISAKLLGTEPITASHERPINTGRHG